MVGKRPARSFRSPFCERYDRPQLRANVDSNYPTPLLAALIALGISPRPRWLGNGKVPVAVTMSDFMQAVKEVGGLVIERAPIRSAC